MAVQHLKPPGDPAPNIAPYMIIPNLTQIGLPEHADIEGLLLRVLPGARPGLLSGWLRPATSIRQEPREIHPVVRGIEQALDKAVYTAFFAGPAAVIWGYQTLLRLTGKQPEDSFPHGTWQFYVNYALREDTARHSNETAGFDTALQREQLALSEADRISAWVMAIVQGLHQYHALLKNEWRERVYIALLAEVAREGPTPLPRLFAAWIEQRPTGLDGAARPGESYPRYRRRRFNAFLRHYLQGLEPADQQRWLAAIRRASREELPAYLAQMSILGYLEPGVYAETTIPIPLSQAQVGIIRHGRYYLLPACVPGTEQPPDLATIRAQVQALLQAPAPAPTPPLEPLATLRRAALARLRPALSPALLSDLDLLRAAPILLNCDQRPRALPLSAIRRAERGVGDHALTIFDTGSSFVFDQSHIFFDGTWGAAWAQRMTSEALSWARQMQPADLPAVEPPFSPALPFAESDLEALRSAPRVTEEATAETQVVDLAAISALRQVLGQADPAVRLTVNDLLVLYRAIHATTYQPAPELIAELELLQADPATSGAAVVALEALAPARRENPAILIPVDVSQRSPRDRLHTTSFEAPLEELQLLKLHQQAIGALNAQEQQPAGAAEQASQRYLEALAEFASRLAQIKAQTLRGESKSAIAIKLLAYLPVSVQRMLNTLPEWFDVLNDLLKGREVFSNIGAVGPSSTLTRFIAAKDDNEKKSLVWGVMTDAEGTMQISLRDFRPHVAALVAAGQRATATRLAEDYLLRYAAGLNQFVDELHLISRKEELEIRN